MAVLVVNVFSKSRLMDQFPVGWIEISSRRYDILGLLSLFFRLNTQRWFVKY